MIEEATRVRVGWDGVMARTYGDIALLLLLPPPLLLPLLDLLVAPDLY